MIRFAALIVIVWTLVAFLAPLLPLNPAQVDLSAILEAPRIGLWLGADDLGRPVLDRLLLGATTSFHVAVWVILVSTILGTLIGAFSGYVGGWVDTIVVRVIDIFLAFPGILLAIALAGIMGPGATNVIIALAAVGWVGFARLARAQVLSVKHREHVIAARTLGRTTPQIVIKHLLPLINAPLIVEATFGIASVVIAEAGLSFLGLGVQPPEASWGSMIRDGARYMLVAPHLVMAPGFALMLVVLAVNLLGDYLRDRMDVRTELRSVPA